MTRRPPEHGTCNRAIPNRCPCPPCRKRRLQDRYDRANGIRRRVDATQTRVHIQRLAAHGWTQYQIAAAAGIDQATVSVIASGVSGTVRRSTAAAVLGIRLDGQPPMPRGRIDATGTRRRLRALMVLGYTLPQIAARVGAGKSSLQHLAEGRWSMVRTATADQVARVYRCLSATPAPPSRTGEQARNQAMTRGWHGPMAWDDIDNPACQPEPCQAPAPGHVHADDVAELARLCLDDHEIARRLGVSARTVLRARDAHGIPAGAAA